MYIDQANMEYRFLHNTTIVEQSPLSRRPITRRIVWDKPSTSYAEDIPPVLHREDFIEGEPVQPGTSRKRKADQAFETDVQEVYYMHEHYDSGDMYIQQLMERASGSLVIFLTILSVLVLDTKYGKKSGQFVVRSDFEASKRSS